MFENQDATKRTSALSRLTHLFLLDDGVIVVSQLCDHVIINTDWCWPSKQMDTEFCSAH